MAAGPMPRWRQYRTVEGLVRKRSAISAVVSKRTFMVPPERMVLGRGRRSVTVRRRQSEPIDDGHAGVTSRRPRGAARHPGVTPAATEAMSAELGHGADARRS